MSRIGGWPIGGNLAGDSDSASFILASVSMSTPNLLASACSLSSKEPVISIEAFFSATFLRAILLSPVFCQCFDVFAASRRWPVATFIIVAPAGAGSQWKGHGIAPVFHVAIQASQPKQSFTNFCNTIGNSLSVWHWDEQK